jgi:energy-coupling factor transport system permease protein
VLKTLDPLTKLAVAFAFIGYATLTERVADVASLTVLFIALLLVAERMPIRTLLWALLPFVFFAASSSWIYAVAPAQPYGQASGSGWGVALLVALRTISVGLVSVAFAFTTEPADLGRALVHRVGLSRRFVFGALAAIQFLPSLAEDARMARLTARASIGTASRLRVALAGFSPSVGIGLLAGAIRRAGTAALAMELRGLSATSGGSAWRVPRATGTDAIFAVAALLVLGLVRLLGTVLG